MVRCSSTRHCTTIVGVNALFQGEGYQNEHKGVLDKSGAREKEKRGGPMSPGGDVDVVERAITSKGHREAETAPVLRKETA